jgi:LysM repeat protein
MKTRRLLQSIAIISILAALVASPDMAALAWAGRCGDFVTAAAGDTVESIAAACGTTADAIRAANPGVSSQLGAGQVIYVPGGAPAVTATPQMGTRNAYAVQPGDTLGGIAFLFGLPLSTVLALNPQITNPSLIYPGQLINLPGTVSITPTPRVTPVPSSPFAGLKVTSGHGLRVRTGPGRTYPEILSPFVSAVKFTDWRYRKNSVTIDSMNFVWVEVQLNPASGYAVGWILTRDSLGDYFTRPNIGPRLDPRDP